MSGSFRSSARDGQWEVYMLFMWGGSVTSEWRQGALNAGLENDQLENDRADVHAFFRHFPVRH